MEFVLTVSLDQSPGDADSNYSKSVDKQSLAFQDLPYIDAKTEILRPLQREVSTLLHIGKWGSEVNANVSQPCAPRLSPDLFDLSLF